MERSKKHKSMLLKLLPKPASAAAFHSVPFSPGRDHHHRSSTAKLKSQPYIGFSGPLMSNGPAGFDNGNEPTSPKVSCMGQIKCKNKINKLINANKPPPPSDPDQHHDRHKQQKVKKSRITRLFSRSTAARKTDHEKDGGLVAPGNNNEKLIPSLGHMRKFASGRESLANFDWTAQIAPVDHDRECYSDGEGGREREYDEYCGRGERETIIPYSAPMLVGGRGGLGFEIEPKKKINLWKRRTVAPPLPLALIHSKLGPSSKELTIFRTLNRRIGQHHFPYIE